MKKGWQIALGILVPLAVNSILFIFTEPIFSMCVEQCTYHRNQADYGLAQSVLKIIFFIAQFFIIFSLLVSKKYKVPYVLALVVLFAAGAIYYSDTMKGFSYTYKEFDGEKWNAGIDNRIHYAQGILDRGDLQGKCRSEIVQLLGKPDKSDEFTRKHNASMVYQLGCGYLLIVLKGGCFHSADIHCTGNEISQNRNSVH